MKISTKFVITRIHNLQESILIIKVIRIPIISYYYQQKISYFHEHTIQETEPNFLYVPSIFLNIFYIYTYYLYILYIFASVNFLKMHKHQWPN